MISLLTENWDFRMTSGRLAQLNTFQNMPTLQCAGMENLEMSFLMGSRPEEWLLPRYTTWTPTLQGEEWESH